MEEWRLLPFQRMNCFENMAVDEALLRAYRYEQRPPTVRFYSWLRSSVTVGYFQNLGEEVDAHFCREHKIDIVRRPTGGKAVFHDRDLTYSIVADESSSLFSPDIIETYRMIGTCLLRGFEKLGIDARMVGEGRHTEDAILHSYCFSVPVQHELLVEGKKICGSAQMRAKGVFLQHGSILLNFDPRMACKVMNGQGQDMEATIRGLKQSVTSVRDHSCVSVSEDALCCAMREGFEERMNVRFAEGTLSQREYRMKESLLREKYMNDRWNREGKVSLG